jgi:uncharacterized phage-associated protein
MWKNGMGSDKLSEEANSPSIRFLGGYMSYPAAAVANELLDLAGRSNRKLTQIEIQKLVYFAHGWHLALTEQILIPDQIEAWTYGPVVRRLYDALKKFGNSPITEKVLDWKMGGNSGFSYCFPTIQSPSVEDDAYARTVIQSVWDKYGMLGSFKLVEITHLDGSPWQQARAKGIPYISNEEIKDYFKGLATQGPRG